MKPHSPIVLVIIPSKPSYTVTVIVPATTVCMSEARLQSFCETIVVVEVSCYASRVHFTRLEVVSYGRCELICFNSVHVR